ncbi:hypothetical protein ACYPKM_03305 [Pseudomonas aeruginosa]
MSLTQKQQAAFKTVEAVFDAVAKFASSHEAIREHMQPLIDDFEASTDYGYRVRMTFGLKPVIDLVDRRRDSLQLTFDGKRKVKTLVGRCEGVGISIRLAYDENYSHSNAVAADALESLATALRQAPVDAISFNETVKLHEWLGKGAGQQDDDMDLGAEQDEDNPTLSGEVLAPEALNVTAVPETAVEVAADAVAEVDKPVVEEPAAEPSSPSAEEAPDESLMDDEGEVVLSMSTNEKKS